MAKIVIEESYIQTKEFEIPDELMTRIKSEDPDIRHKAKGEVDEIAENHQFSQMDWSGTSWTDEEREEIFEIG